MYWAILLVFIVLPLVLATYLLWRAHQLAIAGRSALAQQWLGRSVPGIEQYAKIFAFRDLLLASGCLLFLALLIAKPDYFKVWIALLAVFGSVHQVITQFAVYQALRQNKKVSIDA